MALGDPERLIFADARLTVAAVSTRAAIKAAVRAAIKAAIAIATAAIIAAIGSTVKG